MAGDEDTPPSDTALEHKNALSIAANIKRFANNLKKSGASRITEAYLSARFELLSEYWSTFRSSAQRLADATTETDQETLSFFTNDEYSLTEESFLDSSTYIRQKMLELRPSTSTDSSNFGGASSPLPPPVPENRLLPNNLKLPPVTIPKFNGEYHLWQSFYDLFKTLVHDNPNLSPVHKLHYLKSSLLNEPENMLRNLQITAANYETAWEQLTHRYNNKRVLVNTHIKAILDQPPMSADSATEIKLLLDVATESLQSLRHLGVDTTSWDCLVIYTMVQRLTKETRQLWEQSQGANRDLPTLIQFNAFMEARYRALEVTVDHSKVTAHKDVTMPRKRQVYHSTNTRNQSSQQCDLCRGDHYTRNCDEFKSKIISARFEAAKRFNLCTNCLTKGHFSAACLSTTRCQVCQKRHHTMLHQPSTTATSTSSTPSSAQATPSSSTNVASFHSGQANGHQVLLATALVRISTNGEETLARALLDQGSECSFITEAFARRLNLKLNPVNVCVSGIGNESTTSNNETCFMINAYFQRKLCLNVQAYTLKTLAGTIPTTKLLSSSWEHTKDLKLADPSFSNPGKIDIILGVDVYNHILLDGIIKGPSGTPVAQKTMLGWVLSGKAASVPHAPRSNQNIISCVARISLNDQLKQFWELEEVPTSDLHTEEEKLCEEIFRSTHKRTESGRFIVKLPFVKQFGEEVTLGSSRNIALSRLNQLERKFNGNKGFHQDYSQVMKEYLDLNHMEAVRHTEELHTSKLSTCYIPHHAVIKETSSTSKTRVVFDASRPTKSGYSLNQCLLNGPTLQEDITSITLRWRKHKIAMTSDIAKMYRQIRVDNDDADMQRIVWRWTPEEPVCDYRLLTLTFGTKSAAYLAIKCLHTIAEIERARFPLAYTTITQDFYVDDLLSGADTLEDAINIKRQVSEVLHRGGFELRKWSSNDQSFLEGIPDDELETKIMLSTMKDNTVKTLGIYWDPINDCFQFKVTLDAEPNLLNKRNILSDIAKLYDPHGWLAPIIIRAKILLQSLWLVNCNWDDALPQTICDDWIEYRNDLWAIEAIRIQRWINCFSTSKNVELHCFTDASIQAYAASLYIRTTDDQGEVHVNLLMAKTKVAPVKQVSLPRLELCGVVLGAKLLNYAQNALKLPSVKVYGWTDSSIVLAWLNNHPNKWKTFVGNRVGEIHRTSGTTVWRHVPTKDNPADVASRGISPNLLKSHPLWWHGPQWLHLNPTHWPKLKVVTNDCLEERKVSSMVSKLLTTPSTTIMERFPTYTRLIRSTAYIWRFINKCQRTTKATGHLTIAELKHSLSYWIKQTQLDAFSSSIRMLSSDCELKNDDKLLSLNPFLDEDGILRVGGRLEHSHLNIDAKHPIILPKHHHLTNLLINKFHRSTLHGGAQVISGLMRKQYWIVDARNVIRNQISKCTTCRRHQATIRTQLMGQLPASRIRPSRPFQNTGVDYAGPFEIKVQKGRGSKFTKGYVCLFICMAVKAVHLELVSDLSTPGFLAAFRRFVARRGLCSTMQSDNGTNFVGANNTLSKEFNRAQMECELSKLLTNDGVEWRFIPPGAPNFGGLWEAGIKSTKYHLKRVLGNSHLTYEEFSTVLTQVEGVLNSRPLCPLTNDPCDMDALTPGHFLVGDAIVAPPEPNLLELPENRLDRWKRTQQLVQSFWKRWNLEYVSRLQQRPKWMKIQPNLRMNDMVLVKQDNMPPSKWLLGRIIETHPGQDGIVRVVSIRTIHGITKKSVSKICILVNNE